MNQKIESYNRTSIEIANLKDLRKYCFEKNITMKDFINKAIEEKLKRERKQTQLT